MNRSDLVREFADSLDLPAPEARRYFDTLLMCVTQALARGERVNLDGFGVFALRHRTSRITTNPATGQPMVIEAADVPTFRPSPRLREAINQPRTFLGTKPPQASPIAHAQVGEGGEDR